MSPAAGATMKLNSTGEPVGQLQSMLKNLGYYNGEITKKYDTTTKQAVASFQKKNGLKSDGLAGAETRALLESGTGLTADATPTPKPTAEPTPTKEPVWEIPKSTVKRGSEGADAKTVQTRLKELGYYQGSVDGKFGRASVNALKNFQTNNALNADGIAGKKTYAKLFNASAVPFAVAETPAPVSEIPQAAETPAAESSFWTTLRTGDSGTDVKQLQENLIQLGYMSGTPDGKYGNCPDFLPYKIQTRITYNLLYCLSKPCIIVPKERELNRTLCIAFYSNNFPLVGRSSQRDQRQNR